MVRCALTFCQAEVRDFVVSEGGEVAVSLGADAATPCRPQALNKFFRSYFRVTQRDVLMSAPDQGCAFSLVSLAVRLCLYYCIVLCMKLVIYFVLLKCNR